MKKIKFKMTKRKLTADEIEDILDFIQLNKHIPYDSAVSVMNIQKSRIRKQLVEQMVYDEIIPDLKEQIKRFYFQSLIQPGESVGILCAQSIGEKNTQNSVDFDTKILIKKANKITKIKVGELIDKEMLEGKIKILEEDSFVKEVSDIQIMTISQDEKIEWKNITELSKHPTNGNLVKITTKSGREVVTTLSHSHLKKQGDSIVPVLGSELKLKDRIPVIKRCPIPTNNINSIKISDYIEYDRIDDEFIYIYKEKLKNNIELNDTFGWFIGFYLSDGKLNEYSTITINDNKTDSLVEHNIRKFCDYLDLKYVKCVNSQNVSYHINSIILSTFIKKICNDNMNVPDFVYGTSKSFISSLLKGYMDNKWIFYKQEIRTCFSSKSLLQDFCMLFSYFGIYTDTTKFNELIIYNEYISLYRYCIGSDLLFNKNKISEMSQLDIDKSNEQIPSDIFRHLEKISSILDLKENISSKEIDRKKLGDFIEIFKEESIKQNINIDEHLKYCEISYNSDVVWDEIVDISLIKEHDYKHKYVYDFSVKGNETFALFSGIVVHNTLNTLIKGKLYQKYS